MKKVTIHQAKTNLSQLIKAACDGEEVVISRGPQPVARLVPIVNSKGDRKPGALEGRLNVGPEFFEPLSEEELSRWE